ncbi:MAG TPA: trigger factor [Clostridiaceae bacterium]|nr:trigger factor [Clostridiaceae bacterium]
MNVKVEDLEKNVKQLEIEVDEETFNDGMQKSYIKNAKKFNVPGFRRGKAPRAIVERYYGEEVLYEDAINIVCPKAYEQAIKDYDIHPVDRPEIDIKQIGKGKSLIFTAKVVVKPEVELGIYKGVEVEKPEVVVTDEDVEKELNMVAEKNARIITVDDRGIEKGDIAVIYFEGFIDGKAFEGGKGTDFNLTIGSGQFIPGFEDQLIGAKTGDEVDVNVSFPEDYGHKELAGKPALFKVKIKEVKVKELPEIDDEFAKDISEFDTLAEYKEDLRKKLIEAANHRAEHEIRDKVVSKVVDNATVDIPQVMLDKHIDYLIYDFSLRLRYQGLDLGKYLEIMGLDEKSFRDQFLKRAEKEVKTQLVLEKIEKTEEINVSEEEVEEEIKQLSENYKQSVEDFKKHLSPDDIEYIKSELITRKTIDLLVSSAKLI